ncbi:hypothetical protein SFRURICE_013965 [Spodoptera frugiperda]|nr:hypothetical protein SFRURICE_013965 [Spodoptera frugiperda]
MVTLASGRLDDVSLTLIRSCGLPSEFTGARLEKQEISQNLKKSLRAVTVSGIKTTVATISITQIATVRYGGLKGRPLFKSGRFPAK